MSLNKLLAVGRSFAGIRDEKSPFEMRRENLLPIFVSSTKFSASKKPFVQPELPVMEPPAERTLFAPAPKAAPPVAAPAVQKQERRKLVWYLSFGLLGRRKPAVGLVQGEMKLDNIRVLRNDLADADLELVLKKKRVRKPEEEPIKPVRAPEVPARPSSRNESPARLFETAMH